VIKVVSEMVLVTNTESLIVFAVSVLTNMVDTPIIAPEEVEIPSVETVSAFPDVLIHSIVLI
jgi:hypothetical protein